MALQYLRDTEARVLEIGSFEGRSAIAFLEMLPKCHVTTVDIFDKPAVEERCRNNLASYGDRVEIIKMGAAGALESLWDRRFDVIYLDAAKTEHGAFAHSALSWQLLTLGGTIIWDDLKWDEGSNEWDNVLPGQRPGPGILLFRSAFKPCMSVVHQGSQLIARKTKDWP